MGPLYHRHKSHRGNYGSDSSRINIGHYYFTCNWQCQCIMYHMWWYLACIGLPVGVGQGATTGCIGGVATALCAKRLRNGMSRVVCGVLVATGVLVAITAGMAWHTVVMAAQYVTFEDFDERDQVWVKYAVALEAILCGAVSGGVVGVTVYALVKHTRCLERSGLVKEIQMTGVITVNPAQNELQMADVPGELLAIQRVSLILMLAIFTTTIMKCCTKELISKP